MLSLDKILIPIDFSEFTETAIRTGSEYAEKFDAELVICHVYEEPLYPADMGFSAENTEPEGVPPELTKRLQAVGEKFVPDGVRWQHTVLVGPSAYVAIVTYAEQEKVDLIMLPTHGRTGIAHVFMGSTAERVVRKASCPVLVLRDRPGAGK